MREEEETDNNGISSTVAHAHLRSTQPKTCNDEARHSAFYVVTVGSSNSKSTQHLGPRGKTPIRRSARSLRMNEPLADMGSRDFSAKQP